MLPTQRVPGKGHGGGFPCRSPSSRAALGFLKAKGQPPATSPRRIPGAPLSSPLLLGLLLAGSPPAASGGCASSRARLVRRAGSGDCFGSPARPRGPQRASPPCSLGPVRPSGNWQIRPRPRPPGWRAGPALSGGARGTSGQPRGPRNRRRGELSRSQYTPSSELPSASSGGTGPAPAARRRPRPPRARALARPARVPRAPPLCD